MLFFEIIGWFFLAILVLAGVVATLYLVVAIGMSFYLVFLMAVAYLKGGKEGLKLHNQQMKLKYGK